jgi:hypothetical protein
MTPLIEIDEHLVGYQKPVSDKLRAGDETANASGRLSEHSQMCGSSYGFWLGSSSPPIAIFIDFEDLPTRH